MARSRDSGQLIARCWALLAFAFLVALTGQPAAAGSLQAERLCHAVTDLQQGDGSIDSLRYRCSGAPVNYEQRSLWLRVTGAQLPTDQAGLALMVHQSRFDRLAVAFTYADGVTLWQSVATGRFGAHWRAGGQIEFDAPQRVPPLTAVTMRFDRQSSASLLRLRLIDRGAAMTQSMALAAAIGAALMLLLIGALYNISLAVAVRRQYLAWHGAWAACIALWGGVWSELHLLVAPDMAGTISAQIGTFLACLAVGLATTGAATAFERRYLPRALRIFTLTLGATIAALGVPLAILRGGQIVQMADLLNILILVDLAAVVLAIIWAWRRGSPEARDFAGAWSVPMAALAFISIVDVENLFWGAGSKIVVLLASTWMTLWLSVVATRRFAKFRVERDQALAAEAQAQQLARRDALTGLNNRRGFVEGAQALLDKARSTHSPSALLLLDLDRFKMVNDMHGHDAGDAVLSAVARRLERWEGDLCRVGRMGGEEFALMIVGLEGFALACFAESVRRGIAGCDHSAHIGARQVTASIGIAETRGESDLHTLYSLADKALYDAKHDGRDRVAARRLEALRA